MGKGARSQLARKLRLLRVLHDWSQEDLAGASGLHRTSISLIERGECNVGLDTLERLAGTFGIALTDLLNVVAAPEDIGRHLSATLNKTKKRQKRRRAC